MGLDLVCLSTVLVRHVTRNTGLTRGGSSFPDPLLRSSLEVTTTAELEQVSATSDVLLEPAEG